MHSMSALMLLLVQTCCHGIAKEAGKITQAKADVPVDAADRDVRMGELLAMVSCPALSLPYSSALHVGVDVVR